MLAAIRDRPVASAEQSALERALVELRERAASSQRLCKSCGELKDKAGFSTNQWKQSKRRCLRCQQSGVSTSLAEREEAAAREEEARALARIHEEHMAVERARVQQELARRNACERPDDECPICFEAVADALMRAAMPCNAKHWVCKVCLREISDHAKASGELSCACPYCRAEAPLEALESLHAVGVS